MKLRPIGKAKWRTSNRRHPARALAEHWPKARVGTEVEVVRRRGAEPELWVLRGEPRAGWYRAPWRPL